MRWYNPSENYSMPYDNESYTGEPKRKNKCNCPRCSYARWNGTNDYYEDYQDYCYYQDNRNESNQRNSCPCSEKNKVKPNKAAVIQLELTNQESVAIGAEENVIFDKVLTNAVSGIKYERYTGKIYVEVPGTYYVEWWVAADGITGGADVFTAFSIVTSQGKKVKATNPNASGQISGMALLQIDEVSAGGVAIQLKNTTDGTIGLGNVPVKAGLSIIRLEV